MLSQHKELLSSFIDRPILVARPGLCEIEGIIKNIVTKKLCQNAGFYGKHDTFIKWKDMYIACLKNCDYLLISIYQTGRYDISFKKLAINNPIYKYPNYLEFYLPLMEKITNDQENKKCLIISSMTDSMNSNLDKLDKGLIFPDFKINTQTFVFVKAPNTILGQEYPHNNWEESYLYLKTLVDKNFEEHNIKYALISCGCYGLPICDYIFSKYKISTFYVGGILQLLFGIRGKRWDVQSIIKKYINEHWIRPLKSEIPKNYKKIEKGCYW